MKTEKQIEKEIADLEKKLWDPKSSNNTIIKIVHKIRDLRFVLEK